MKTEQLPDELEPRNIGMLDQEQLQMLAIHKEREASERATGMKPFAIS